MFEKKIYLWNAVDVAGASDGLMRRGLVVDVKETGLIIDFAIPEKQPEFVCYENVHFDEGDCLDGYGQLFDETDADEVPPGQADHEVLFRLSSDQPWIWYPALVLAGCSTTYLLVDIQIPAGDHIRRVFRHKRVYKLGMASITERMVRRSEFIKEDVDVPENVELNEEFIAKWKERYPKTHPVGVVGSRFLYIRRSDSRTSPSIDCLRTDPSFTTNSASTVLRTSGLKRTRPYSQLGNRKKLHKATITEEEYMSCEHDLYINDLPPEIHAEIMAFLDVQQEHVAGQVCGLWRSLLAAPKRRAGLVVNLDLLDKDDSEAWYKLAVIILQRFQKNPNLYFVAITGQKGLGAVGERDTVLEIVLMLKGILHKREKLPIIYMANMTIKKCTFVETGMLCTLTDEFRSASKRLILKNICIPYLFGPYGYRTTDVAPYDVSYISNGTIEVEDPAAEVRNLCEKAADVYCFTDKTYTADLDLVSSWIRTADRKDTDPGITNDYDFDTTTNRYTTDKSAILEILKRWQPDDIRFRPSFLWENVRAAKLDRNLLSLRKSTLVALICCRKFRLSRKSEYIDGDGDTEEDLE